MIPLNRKPKNVLVAGGAGFIGSHLCDHLLSLGDNVLVVDSLVTGRRKNIEHLIDAAQGAEPMGRSFTMLGENSSVEEKSLDLEASSEFRLGGHEKIKGKFVFVEHDICRPLEESSEITKFIAENPLNQIYNLASPASPKDFETKSLLILETGSIGHKNLLELATKQSARILISSTSEVYGDAQVHPQPETYFGNVNTIGQRSCYDESKRFAEALTMAYHREKKTDIRIARIFNTYGPRMAPNDGRIIPNFFCQALSKQPLTIYGDGAQTRSFCFVTDMVLGLFSLMESTEKTPVNIGNPIERKVVEMADIVNKLTDNNFDHQFHPLPENDPKQRRPDISKAKRTINWQPTIKLEEGLQATLEYFKAVVHEFSLTA